MAFDYFLFPNVYPSLQFNLRFRLNLRQPFRKCRFTLWVLVKRTCSKEKGLVSEISQQEGVFLESNLNVYCTESVVFLKSSRKTKCCICIFNLVICTLFTIQMQFIVSLNSLRCYLHLQVTLLRCTLHYLCLQCYAICLKKKLR